MKLGKHFDVIHKFPVPEHVYRTKDDDHKEGWSSEFRTWCRSNLQDGWELVNLFGEKWIVNVTDEIDYDLLVLKWGK